MTTKIVEDSIMDIQVTKLRIRYHGLAIAILEQSKKTGKIRRDEYENIIVPYMTVIKSLPISRDEVSNSLNRSMVQII